MAKDYKKVAESVLSQVGGAGNVSHLEHCSTRLRFTLADPAKADREKLKAIPGVMGVIGSGNQCQVVIGNDVIEVYDEINKLDSFGSASGNAPKPAGKVNVGAWLLDFMVGVFQPLVSAIAGAGILKAMLSLLVMLGWIDTTSAVYTVLLQAADAALYFLPIMVAVTMSTKLKMNRLVSVAVVGVSLLPAMTAAISEGMNLFGINVQTIAYAYQVFPAILTVGFLYFVEKYATKWTPKPIRVFFVPMVCMILVVPVSLLILGPLGYNIGQLLTTVILFIYGKLGWLAVGLLAAILPFMIAMGMHKALVPYAVSSISNMGEELLYMPASLAHNISESGACFAVALKTKDEELRSAAVSAGISALFGITEPALYGVTLQHKKVLRGVIVGSFVGGIFVGLMGLKAFVAMGPGLAGMAMFVDPANAMNIVWGFAGFGISLVVSFAATMVMFKDNPKEEAIAGAAMGTLEPAGSFVKAFEPAAVASPVDGKCIDLSTVRDEVFASGIMGKGVAFELEGNKVTAPGDGEIVMVAATKHAVGLKLENGLEVLIHVGMDTVNLEGKGFDVQVRAGDKVSKGQTLIVIDRDYMNKQGVDLTTPIIVTNSEDKMIESAKTGQHVSAGDEVMIIAGVKGV